MATGISINERKCLIHSTNYDFQMIFDFIVEIHVDSFAKQHTHTHKCNNNEKNAQENRTRCKNAETTFSCWFWYFYWRHKRSFLLKYNDTTSTFVYSKSNSFHRKLSTDLMIWFNGMQNLLADGNHSQKAPHILRMIHIITVKIIEIQRPNVAQRMTKRCC